jgi:hypothetical protein
MKRSEALGLVHGFQSTHRSQQHFGTAREVLSRDELEGVLTRDGSILGEFAHNFANFGGDERLTRKRQAVRNLPTTN